MTREEQIVKTRDHLRARKGAYQLAFNSPAGKAVLKDLTTFCRGVETCFDPDSRKHAALEGRREVYLRIVYHLGFTPEQLVMFYAAKINGSEE